MFRDDFKEEFEKEFGKMDSRKLWLLVRFAKHVRLRARNNTAFNNFANRTFPYAHFKQVEKVKPSTGEIYQGLSITVDGEFNPQVPDDTEE